MLSKKVSLSSLLIICAVCCAITFVLSKNEWKHKAMAENVGTKISTPAVMNSCGTVSHRLEGYKYIKPLLFGDKTCESGNYYGLKTELVDALERYKQQGIIDHASVYLKILGKGEFISINENEMYHPGSLIKLPILLTYLSMEERNKGVLNKKIEFKLPKGGVPPQTYNSHQIEVGKSYTIKELLTYMIAYSDNNATYLLNENVDLEAFKKMFADFGLEVPDVHSLNFQMTAKDYSAFLKVVYNGSYLNLEDSEFAAELLTRCDFEEGMASGLPDSVEIAHKFGGWGDRNNGAIHQLAESGIVYSKNMPYLLTVMTEGKVVKRLPEVLGGISKIVYTSLKDK